MLKLTDTQLVLLAAAAQREDHLITRPEHLKGGAAQKVGSKLVSLGLAQEVPVRADEPAWRTGEDGIRVGLRLTSAGLDAIGIEVEPTQGAEVGSDSETSAEAEGAPSQERAGPRAGSKQALVVSLLRREAGATIDELVAATSWLPHTTRAALTGLRQRGYEIGKQKDEGGWAVYRIDSGEGRAGEGTGSVEA